MEGCEIVLECAIIQYQPMVVVTVRDTAGRMKHVLNVHAQVMVIIAFFAQMHGKFFLCYS